MLLTAGEWKRFYEAEREHLSLPSLERLIEGADILPLERGLIFPHTRLSRTGSMMATAARSVVESGVDRVVALGVLHGGRSRDSELVAAAKRGEAHALAVLRRIHGPGTLNDEGIWSEEFSLDNFKHFVFLASRLYGRTPPNIIERYPYFTGSEPSTLPGMAELEKLKSEGVPVVATADFIHHGIGYETPVPELLDEERANARDLVTSLILRHLESLRQRDYDTFLSTCESMKSDFRHSGPVLRELSDDFHPAILTLDLVDYSDVLQAERPTWVAAALVTA